ncbi:MAG TPA: preprotein translocase subunit SecA [Dehalococcoidia bacterium]|nr:preprotein translocase subunit SecA [Dehalococcoidia bacterium]
MVEILSKIFGDPNKKILKNLSSIVSQINDLETIFEDFSDPVDFKNKTEEFKERVIQGESLDDILPEAYALVREASKRILGQRHFDVQLIGGVVLHQGNIAEMKTGEGKTLVATLPSYLNALSGNGVHVVTVNDYLAIRDASWMGPIHRFLGLKVGCLQQDKSYVLPEIPINDSSGEMEELIESERRVAYSCDILYGTNNEFGFDYLRDNMVDSESRLVQKDHAFAIVDEVDNILIDEARTPLIISGPVKDRGQDYKKFANLARTLHLDQDFTSDEKNRTINLTDDGINKIETTLNLSNLYDQDNFGITHFIENAIKANVHYIKDREYVINDGQVVLVDEFTGRLMQGRRYSDGLHQAIEAKENLKIQRESATYATITLQNYFRIYSKLSGMTGTASTEAEEFDKIYGLDVIQIPTNRPNVRKDIPDLIFNSEKSKFNALVKSVKDLQKSGRPVLVGTTSIEKSELLSNLLRKNGVNHQVLNAKQHDQEALIIADAGKTGTVTVATNMAGRGTDIILGGSKSIGEEEWSIQNTKVLDLGGLKILGSERHESRRIDNQLRGRSGRQGDPGGTQFYISAEDDLMKRFGGDRIQSIMNMVGLDEETPIENKLLTRAVESAQSKVEGFHFEIRKTLVDYDDVINTQREIIYKLRKQAFDDESLKEKILDMVHDEIEDLIMNHLDGDSKKENLDIFFKEFSKIIPNSKLNRELVEGINGDPSSMSEQIHKKSDEQFDFLVNNLGHEQLFGWFRFVLLRSIDSHWVEHLTIMDNMRQGIGLQAVGQRNPLVQYKTIGFQMFEDLMFRINRDTAKTIFNLGINFDSHNLSKTSLSNNSLNTKKGSVMDNVNQGHGEKRNISKKIGRNDPCPCGSGKKYKKCSETQTCGAKV